MPSFILIPVFIPCPPFCLFPVLGKPFLPPILNS